MITLYEHPLSPYAQKCKIALAEKGVEFQATMPIALGSGQTGGEFAAANPRGEVPVLVDGDLTVFDSTVILEYVEDRWPEPPLLPATPPERARVRTIEDVMDTHYEAINWGLAEIQFFRRAEGELADRLIARAAEQTARLQDWLEERLEGRPWFNGDGFGWGDLAVVPFVNGSVGFGNAPKPGSALSAWLERANARPSVAAAAGAASEASGGMEGAAEAVEQGLFKREYRDHRLEWMIKSGGISVVLEGLERQNVRFVDF